MNLKVCFICDYLNSATGSSFYHILGHEISEYCTVMLLKQTPDGKITQHDEKYYLLSEVLPKDAELRDTIKKSCIKKVLEQHQFERTDENYTRECLYCRDVVDPTRHLFVEHLYNKHGLLLGKPENLVFIDELIDVVQGKLETLICLYCEKLFKVGIISQNYSFGCYDFELKSLFFGTILGSGDIKRTHEKETP